MVQLVRAPVRRAEDPGSNPGSGENFSLKLTTIMKIFKSFQFVHSNFRIITRGQTLSEIYGMSECPGPGDTCRDQFHALQSMTTSHCADTPTHSHLFVT